MPVSLKESIRSHLEEKAEPKLAQFASALIPNLSRPMLGVRIPRLREYARLLAKDVSLEDMLEIIPEETFEEILVRGLFLGYAPLAWKIRWTEICKFVPYIDNWSVCDSCCATYHEVRRHRTEVWSDLVQFLNSEEEFTQRFAIVMMLDHFLVDDYIDGVLTSWRHVEPHGFYVEMALGWGLSVAFLRYPKQTMEVLLDSEVPCACRKKACQKILESRRTPESYRSAIRTLRTQLTRG